MTFIATHVIQTGTRRWYVHAEEADCGDLILYTQEEWEANEAASWALDVEEGLMYLGSTTDPIVTGSLIDRFEDCRWTRSDGWNDNGTRAS